MKPTISRNAGDPATVRAPAETLLREAAPSAAGSSRASAGEANRDPRQRAATHEEQHRRLHADHELHARGRRAAAHPAPARRRCSRCRSSSTRRWPPSDPRAARRAAGAAPGERGRSRPGRCSRADEHSSTTTSGAPTITSTAMSPEDRHAQQPGARRSRGTREAVGEHGDERHRHGGREGAPSPSATRPRRGPRCRTSRRSRRPSLPTSRSTRSRARTAAAVGRGAGRATAKDAERVAQLCPQLGRTICVTTRCTVHTRSRARARAPGTRRAARGRRAPSSVAPGYCRSNTSWRPSFSCSSASAEQRCSSCRPARCTRVVARTRRCRFITGPLLRTDAHAEVGRRSPRRRSSSLNAS